MGPDRPAMYGFSLGEASLETLLERLTVSGILYFLGDCGDGDLEYCHFGICLHRGTGTCS
jgi:hypothetical protein